MKHEFAALDRRIAALPVGSQFGFLFLRLLLALTLLLEAFISPLSSHGIRSVVRALPIAYAAAACTVYRLRRTRRLSDAIGTGLFMMDLAACLVVAYFVEGRGNTLYTVLLLLILGSCLLQRPAWVLGVSSVASLLYGFAVLPPLPMSGNDLLMFYQHLTLFFLITLFAIHIADHAGQVERETALRYEERLAWMQRLSMVGRAMAAVLHEAKTPLGTIVLNAEAASQALEKGERPEEEIRTIGQEADQAAAILQNFLDFVKPSELELKPIELREPLQQAAGMTKIRLEERGIELELQTLADCRVRGSARHLLQVFSNILNNAIDAMPSGGKLRVWMEKEDSRILVRFQDNGQGMDRDALANLFEPFSTSKASEEGHGLGLSIVRWIMHKHGGDVSVESEGPNLGTSVTLVFPR